jgi:hypothetical protein
LRDACSCVADYEESVEANDRAGRNADHLDQYLAATARDDAVDSSRAEAVAHLDAYVNLLRETLSSALEGVPAPPRRMMLKLEFDDGRWDITEDEVTRMPSVGDSLRLADGRLTRVREIQRVLSGRSCKPPRTILVCTISGNPAR